MSDVLIVLETLPFTMLSVATMLNLSTGCLKRLNYAPTLTKETTSAERERERERDRGTEDSCDISFSLPVSSVPAFPSAQGSPIAVCGSHASLAHVSCQIQLQG